MDLLNENKYQEQSENTKGKKLVKRLLIFSIIFAILIILLMIYLEITKVEPTTLEINGNTQEISVETIVKDNNGNQYIAIKELTEHLGYEYYNSEYQKYGIDSAKCYIKNGNLIFGFELDTNQVYKYEEGTNLDFQYYTLKNNIITYNNKLYISLVDLQQALNLYCTIDENNTIRIQAPEHIAKLLEEKAKENGYTIVEDQNSMKALAYGYVIVNKEGTYNVLNLKLEEIIGGSYTNMYFNEYNMDYIVKNSNGQYGIITKTGTIEIPFKFDNIELINYKNMLYKVKYNNKYGIMKKDGNMLTNIIYDEIGYKPSQSDKTLYTLIVPELDGKSGETIVVKQNEKYGLVYLKTGEEFLPCDHVEKLYSINELGEIVYKIEAEEQIVNLIEYLQFRETQKINLN